MAYLAQYTDSDGRPVLLYIGRGFACTAAELPREIATVCRSRGKAAGPVSFQYVCPGTGRDYARAHAQATGRALYRLTGDGRERVALAPGGTA
ncbi:hypothetical protein DSS3P1_08 [Ruegeria phage DSS3-P1]|uniref:hypothetical protein n=1 Tax=Ruegeria phage DSS3-P1 TaxID=1555208 RepID=UPI0002357D8D|nr:hypothetical protein DSS3P1_08 [Ruegeria phage DSS3-P1]YP_009997224.1 hypothetical protein JT312_gp07 [Ruegeria phage vB_RpoS-V18]YP_009997306.1 hypothetical protein JT313_gp07 [Ruegeria phage vB_RpoS-V11]YP_009997389.1 hypothetical protein JT314_gp08 [Ruegeria phage vB_RpoS-V7]AET42329.1 hypothetical protein SDSG_00064 [Ruegeria phage DSS3-P1]AIT13243.1 hypothetical protein DSS3P1_08 [Ruegeria phage DSS3-P1]AWY08711.1 hypothetical protein vBRpoSV7_08 [Ruegeria phage vB_RpoS-V7]AWY08883.1